VRERALGLLARRERTRAELESRLSPYAESPSELARVLDELVAKGLLSDERFVEAQARTLGRKFGAARVRQRLQRSGANPALVKRALRDIAPDELARARSIWAKRFGGPPKDALDRAKQQRFLHSRGFSFDIIRRVVAGTDHE
jgi:regulatory protein